MRTWSDEGVTLHYYLDRVKQRLQTMYGYSEFHAIAAIEKNEAIVQVAYDNGKSMAYAAERVMLAVR